ncbi:MAG: M23 family metallopeptidase [Thiotrichales bacterium]
MQLPRFNKRGHSSRFRNAQGSWWFIPLAGLSVVSLITGTAVAGYLIGSSAIPQQHLVSFQESVLEQRLLFEDTERDVQANLDALTQRIGLLQAHVNRLNALGSKLVSVSKVSAKEFDFVAQPAMGGPSSELSPLGFGSDDISRAMEKLELALLEKEQQLRVLDQMMLSAKVERAIMPRSMPVAAGYVSSSYGYRSDPFSGRRAFHSGVDFAGALGTPILAAAGGKVTRSESHPEYGKMIEIDHSNGYTTRYAHASELLVKVGDVVKKGQEIAKMGSTGRSTGVHLHFEVHKESEPVNPMTVLNDKE